MCLVAACVCAVCAFICVRVCCLRVLCVCVCYALRGISPSTLQVAGVLDFMNACYTIFGFTYELNLSTRPKKALGSRELWDQAEAMMKDALDTFGKPWRINPGDGAFYGPKVGVWCVCV